MAISCSVAQHNGKAYGIEMSASRQISRRFGRPTGARTCSAASDCVVRTVLFGADPLKPGIGVGRSVSH